MNLIKLYNVDSLKPITVEKRPLSSEILHIVPHWHDYYEIEYIISGTGTYTINGKSYDIQPGMFFLLTPLDIHEIKQRNCNDIYIYILSFDEFSLIPEYRNILFNINVREVYFRNRKRIEAMFEQILKEAAIDDHFSRNNMVSYVNQIVAEFIRNAEIDYENESFSALSNIQQIIQYIRIHLTENISLSSVAKSFNVSPQYLSRLFKEKTETTFKKYIVNLRFNLAVNMIESTDLPVSEICFDTGFGTVNHFLRAFKERYGMTPTEYRNSFR